MKENIIEIICYTDPYCTWCWGSEPILRKLKEQYGEQIHIRYVMGGLVEDIRQFHDPANGIGGEYWYKEVAAHWLEASSRHKMPVDERVFYDMKNEHFSTHPACIAYEVATFQGEIKAHRYLRRLREAASIERQIIQHREVQEALALEVGLDVDLFRDSIESGAAIKAFHRDRLECRQKAIHGFPSYIVKGNNDEFILNGYIPYQTFDFCLRELSGNRINQKEIKVSKGQVLDFISRHQSIALIEVTTVFNISEQRANEILAELTNQGLIKEKNLGNGVMYSITPSILSCNPLSGTCSL
ncbi:DsbA family protein [Photobacterium sp. J15]|uniref:DsbA family protein n=1 Tax=Photobacterium sp. J15 TaxID=265901 RepID=UPI0007E4B16D|nr:DsbA family protein [Photobacterium sp. J15]